MKDVTLFDLQEAMVRRMQGCIYLNSEKLTLP